MIPGVGVHQQPGYRPPNPSVPSIPTYPQIPTIPTIPVYPSYPSYPTYPTYSPYPTYPTYFPFSWSYNTVFNGFSSEYCKTRKRHQHRREENCTFILSNHFRSISVVAQPSIDGLVSCAITSTSHQHLLAKCRSNWNNNVNRQSNNLFQRGVIMNVFNPMIFFVLL